MDWNYIIERVGRYNAFPSDDLLYRIGNHVDLLEGGSGRLTPEQRYLVLNWLTCQDEIEIKHDLALLIFGRSQLTQWLNISRQAYPKYEFYLCFEFQPSHETGWESGINFTMHWSPTHGAPVPLLDSDFPWKSSWDSGELFWGEYPGGSTNQFEFNLFCYANQNWFTNQQMICEEGDWYMTKDDQDADLMSVAQVLEHFAIQV